MLLTKFFFLFSRNLYFLLLPALFRKKTWGVFWLEIFLHKKWVLKKIANKRKYFKLDFANDHMGTFRGFVSRVYFEGLFRGFISRVYFEGLFPLFLTKLLKTFYKIKLLVQTFNTVTWECLENGKEKKI